MDLAFLGLVGGGLTAHTGRTLGRTLLVVPLLVIDLIIAVPMFALGLLDFSDLVTGQGHIAPRFILVEAAVLIPTFLAIYGVYLIERNAKKMRALKKQSSVSNWRN